MAEVLFYFRIHGNQPKAASLVASQEEEKNDDPVENSDFFSNIVTTQEEQRDDVNIKNEENLQSPTINSGDADFMTDDDESLVPIKPEDSIYIKTLNGPACYQSFDIQDFGEMGVLFVIRVSQHCNFKEFELFLFPNRMQSMFIYCSSTTL